MRTCINCLERAIQCIWGRLHWNGSSQVRFDWYPRRNPHVRLDGPVLVSLLHPEQWCSECIHLSIRRVYLIHTPSAPLCPHRSYRDMPCYLAWDAIADALLIVRGNFRRVISSASYCEWSKLSDIILQTHIDIFRLRSMSWRIQR